MWTPINRRRRACALKARTGPSAGFYFALAAILAAPVSGTALAKAPGHTYCFYSTCHRVKSLTETAALVGRDQTLNASFYDSCKVDRLNPCGLTSSGEAFRPDAPDNAASPIYPDGTMLLVWAPDSGQALVVRVNNAGPYWGDRKLDLSRAAAEKLGFSSRGVGKVQVRIVSAPDEDDATYRRNRSYDPVPGYIGRYPSLDEAYIGMANVFAMSSLSTSLLAPLTGGSVAITRSAGTDTIPMLVAAQKTPDAAPVMVARAAPATPRKSTLAFDARKARVRQMAEASHLARVTTPFDLADEFLRTAAFMIDEFNQPIAGSGASAARLAARKAEKAPVRVALRERTPRVAAKSARAQKAVRLAEKAKAAPSRKAVVKPQAVATYAAKPVVTPAPVASHTAPNDMSMFSRYASRPVTAGATAGPRKAAAARIAAKPYRAGSQRQSALKSQPRRQG